MLIEATYIICYETFRDADESDIHMIEIVQLVDGRRDLTTLSEAVAADQQLE